MSVAMGGVILGDVNAGHWVCSVECLFKGDENCP